MKLKSLLSQGKTYLNTYYPHNDTNLLDAEILLMHVLNCDRLRLIVDSEIEIKPEQSEMYMSDIKKRSCGMPVQYITGKSEFMGLDFSINQGVLIPRCDTEILVEAVINYIKDRPARIIEIGTGSGCISISIAKFCKNVHITAVDISDKALELARKNAANNSVAERIAFLKSNIFENIDLSQKVDIIISNPPYIKTEEINTLGKNVKDFEPLLALDGGEDGLDFYKEITAKSCNYLVSGGMLAFEIGYNQRQDVCNIMIKNGFADIICLKDLAGLDRVVYGFLA